MKQRFKITIFSDLVFIPLGHLKLATEASPWELNILPCKPTVQDYRDVWQMQTQCGEDFSWRKAKFVQDMHKMWYFILMSILYIGNNRGPKTEPCGTLGNCNMVRS